MKLVYLLLIPFLWLQADSRVDHIRERYQQINAKISTYRHIEIESGEESSEGGGVTGYLSKDTVMLIVEDVYGEMGKTRTEIYFDHAAPVFIYDRDYKYSRPMYDSTFDEKETQIAEDRTYFYNNKLIRWIDKEHKTRVERDPAFTEKEQALLKYARGL